METGSNFLPVSAPYKKLRESILFKHTLARKSTLTDFSALLVPGYTFYYNASFLHASDLAQFSHMQNQKPKALVYWGEDIIPAHRDPCPLSHSLGKDPLPVWKALGEDLFLMNEF